jgi:hypothetical protein
MPLYFLDSRDGDDFIVDDDGVELDDIDAVRNQAALALAGLARDVLPGAFRRELAIEARDESGRPVLRASLVFETAIFVR